MDTYYFDHNATTPVHEEVLKEMLPYFNQTFYNASSSSHLLGIRMGKKIEDVRKNIANLLSVESSGITFTSSATESLNTALISIFNLYKTKGNHIVACTTEHKVVLDTLAYLKTLGALVTLIPVQHDGIIDLTELKKAVNNSTIAVCVMLANNETGVIQPINEIAEIAHHSNAIMVCDTTQAYGKMHVDLNELNIDVAVLSAHKFYGPKGAGILYARKKNPRVTLSPLLHGGLQDNALRSGTQNVPAIIGMNKALEIAIQNIWENTTQLSKLRIYLEQQLEALNLIKINGSTKYRLCNTSNLQFSNLTSNKFIQSFPQLALATGSACTSILPEPSHVLKAMGLSDLEAKSSIRFSLGITNTMEEIISTINLIKNKLIA